MGLGRTVLIVTVVLILLYMLFRWLFQTSVQLSHLSPATHAHRVPARKLGKNSGSSDYAYSMWFYVEDWNYRYGEDKRVLARAPKANWGPDQASPHIYMDGKTNDLSIRIECYPTPDATAAGHRSSAGNCAVENFPLQRWVNIIVSVYGRTLDIYMDGKLFRTCVLPNVAKVHADDDVYITTGGGFKGYTANYQYWSQAVNPQEAYNIYRSGYGGNWLTNLFNKYRLRVQFLEGNRVHGSFEI